MVQLWLLPMWPSCFCLICIQYLIAQRVRPWASMLHFHSGNGELWRVVEMLHCSLLNSVPWAVNIPSSVSELCLLFPSNTGFGSSFQLTGWKKKVKGSHLLDFLDLTGITVSVNYLILRCAGSTDLLVNSSSATFRRFHSISRSVSKQQNCRTGRQLRIYFAFFITKKILWGSSSYKLLKTLQVWQWWCILKSLCVFSTKSRFCLLNFYYSFVCLLGHEVAPWDLNTKTTLLRGRVGKL